MKQSIEAVQYLRDQHKEIKGLSQQLSTAVARANEMEAGIAQELLMELDLNSQLKRKVFYPALDSFITGISEKAILADRLGDIEETESLLKSLSRFNNKNIQNRPEFKELILKSLELFDAEEKEVFPQAQTLPNQKQLVDQMNQEQERIYSLPEYKNALPSKVQNPHGGEQKRITS